MANKRFTFFNRDTAYFQEQDSTDSFESLKLELSAGSTEAQALLVNGLAGGTALKINTGKALIQAVDAAGDLTVATDKFSVLAASGNMEAKGTGKIHGAATLLSTLDVLNDLKVNTDKFTVASASGNTVIAGTASIAGALTQNADATFKGNIVMDGADKFLTLSMSPTQDMHAVNKRYVDALLEGLDPKQSVRVATTEDIALSGLLVVDGVQLVAGDRVLVKSQTNNTQNGVYVAAAGAWSRAADMDIAMEASAGAYCFVEEGSVNGDNGFVITSPTVGAFGTDPIIWTQFSGAGQVTAGAGMTKSGNQLDVVAASDISAAIVNALKIDADAVGVQFNKDSALAVDATSKAVSIARHAGSAALPNALHSLSADGLYIPVDVAAGLGLGSNNEIQIKLADYNEVAAAESAKELKFDTDGKIRVVGLPKLFRLGGSEIRITDSQFNAIADRGAIRRKVAVSSEITAAGQIAYHADGGMKLCSSAVDAMAPQKAYAFGMVIEAPAGGESHLQTHGVLPSGTLSGLTIGAKYYLGPSGTPVLYSDIGSAGSMVRVIQLGVAVSASQLDLQIMDYGSKRM